MRKAYRRGFVVVTADTTFIQAAGSKCGHVVTFPCSLHEMRCASLPSLSCSPFLSPFTLEVAGVRCRFATQDPALMWCCER